VAGWVTLYAVTAFTREGVVETRSGAVYEGQVRLRSNAVLVANVMKSSLAQVPFTHIRSLRMSPPSAEPNGPSPDHSAPASILNPAGASSRWVPGPWQSEDVGSARTAGDALVSAGLFRVRSSATNVTADSDAFHFVSKQVKGDSEIIARVVYAQLTHPWAKAGLMMREKLTADSRNVLLAVTPTMGVFQWRTDDGQTTTPGEQSRGLSVPCWIRLKREGDTIAGYRSSNGRQWGLVSKTVLPMAEEIFVGLALAGGRQDRLSQATFAEVSEAPSLRKSSFVPQVELQSGSVVTGWIRSVDETAVEFLGAPPKASLSTFAVARIIFQWLSPRQAAQIRSGRPGVLLATGEFVEGSFKGIEKGKAQISSVLFGLRRFDVDDEVIALVLRKATAWPHQCEVKTVDGSTWRGTAPEAGDGEVTMQEASVAHCRIPLYELAELRMTD
jgi:regulation of enolase protein 1 (concanavalin A-like superfamily)